MIDNPENGENLEKMQNEGRGGAIEKIHMGWTTSDDSVLCLMCIPRKKQSIN